MVHLQPQLVVFAPSPRCCVKPEHILHDLSCFGVDAAIYQKAIFDFTLQFRDNDSQLS